MTRTLTELARGDVFTLQFLIQPATHLTVPSSQMLSRTQLGGGEKIGV